MEMVVLNPIVRSESRQHLEFEQLAPAKETTISVGPSKVSCNNSDMSSGGKLVLSGRRYILTFR